jgi:hypothetical protein
MDTPFGREGSKGSKGAEGSKGEGRRLRRQFVENRTTALTGEGKQANRAFGALEMHPYPRLRRYFPRRGKF